MERPTIRDCLDRQKTTINTYAHSCRGADSDTDYYNTVFNGKLALHLCVLQEYMYHVNGEMTVVLELYT
jgi:hypothetical protein